MLKHHSHIRMEAKRTTLQSIVKKSANKDTHVQRNGQADVPEQEALHGLRNNDSTVQPPNSSKAKNGIALLRITSDYAAF